MKNLNELKAKLDKLSVEIRRLMRESEYDDNSNLYGLDFPRDADGYYLKDTLEAAMSSLWGAYADITSLSYPVTERGTLRMGANGYYLLNGLELHCGTVVELLVEDDYHLDADGEPVPYWLAGRIEHDGDGYYFTSDRKARLEGAKARIRG